MADDDIVPINQLPENDIIPLHQLPNTNTEGILKNAIKGIQSLGHMATVGRDAFMNTATAGASSALEKAIPLPDNINSPLGYFNPNMTQPQNPAENVMAAVGNVGGFMGGAPEAVMKEAGKDISSIIPGMIGKVAGSVGAGAAGGFSLPGDLGDRVKNAGIGSVLNPAVEGAMGGFRGLSDLTNVNQAKARIFDATEKASNDFESNINQTSKNANIKMGKGLDNINDTGLNQETGVNQALRNAADAKPNLAQHLLPLIENIQPEVDAATGIIKDIPSMSGQELQSKIIDTLDRIEHPVAKAEFGTQMSKIIPDSMKTIKGTRAGVYTDVENAQPLTKIGMLNRIAKGTVTPQKLQELKQIAANVGNGNSIQDLIKAGSDLNRARAIQGVAKNIKSVGKFGGIYEIIRHILG